MNKQRNKEKKTVDQSSGSNIWQIVIPGKEEKTGEKWSKALWENQIYVSIWNVLMRTQWINKIDIG